MKSIKKTIKLSSKFQLTLPNDIRTALKIEPNELLTIEVTPAQMIQISKSDLPLISNHNMDFLSKGNNKNQESKINFILDKSFGILHKNRLSARKDSLDGKNID